MTLELVSNQPKVAYTCNDLNFTIANEEQQARLEEQLEGYRRRLGATGVTGAGTVSRSDCIAAQTFETIVRRVNSKVSDHTPQPIRLHSIVYDVEDAIRWLDLSAVLTVPPIYVPRVHGPRLNVLEIQNVGGLYPATFARAYSKAQDYCRPAPHLRLA